VPIAFSKDSGNTKAAPPASHSSSLLLSADAKGIAENILLVDDDFTEALLVELPFVLEEDILDNNLATLHNSK
jgi:hypothetical protein